MMLWSGERRSLPDALSQDALDWIFERATPEPNSGCWLWLGSLGRDGYARALSRRRASRLVHRWIYELFYGEIPTGLEIDHKCKTRHCINPDHLEAVTHYVNNMRGDTIVANYIRRTHCDNGHEYTEENTMFVGPKHTSRRCRACHNEQTRKWKEARR